MNYLVLFVSSVGGLGFAVVFGESDVVYLKAVTVICGCKAFRVIIFLLDLSQVKTPWISYMTRP
jgi:hypothetical protein